MDDLATTPPTELIAPTPLAQSPAAVYLASLSTEKGRRAQRCALEQIARILVPSSNALSFPWHQLGYQHVQAIRTTLIERNLATATVNRYLAALKGTLRQAYQLDQMPDDLYHRAMLVPPAKGTSLPAGHALDAGELRALFVAASGDSAAQQRDTALLAVLLCAGLRRAEITALDLADYDPREQSLRIRGKGNRERFAYLNDAAVAHLDRYLQRRGYTAGALFGRAYAGKTGIQVDRLTDQAIAEILNRLCDQAQVRHCSPHDFRRTFISNLLDAGIDISTAQALAGHANVTTTQRYDRRGEARKRAAVAVLAIPEA